MIATAGVLTATMWCATGCTKTEDSGANATPANVSSTNGQPAAMPSNTRPPAPSNTANVTPAATGSGPIFSFASATHNFGDMLETETRNAVLAFTNTGNSTLNILDVTTTCGCTAASLAKRSYAPGESGTIEVAFDPTGPNEPGRPQLKYVNVLTNASPTPTKLQIRANVMPFIIMEPRMMTFGELVRGIEHRKTLEVTSIDENFELVDVKPQTTYVQTVRRPSRMGDDGKRREVVEFVIPANVPWGGLYFPIDVTVRGKTSPDSPPITHTTTVRFGAQLYGQLKGEPRDRFGFGLKPVNEAFTRDVTLVRTTGQPFTVLDYTLEAGGLPEANVTVEQIAPDRWTFTLNGRGGTSPTNYNGRVIVRTDVPGEDLIEIPIFGVVRKATPGA